MLGNNDDNYIYELVFNAISNVSRSKKQTDVKRKIIRIITKIIENIVNAEIKNEDSEKFRRIKVTNPNISLMFDIKGNYDFIKSLGFEEEFFGEDLYLFLPKKKINIPLFQKLLSYIELLLLNFQENEEDEQNYYEKNNNLKKSMYSQDYFNNPSEDKKEEDKIIDNNYNNKDILQILKETKDVRLGNNNKNMEYGKNWNNRRVSQDGARILRETGQQRYLNALKYSRSPNKVITDWNKKKNNNFQPNIHTLSDYNQFPSNNYNNSSNGQYKDIKCRDKIGKKCLELTNAFRAKHHLPPLLWDDAIWKISLGHSKNMGDRKVDFGHHGFDDRIRQFPFSYSLACENVYMCSGYREYTIANNAVDGWINSPGHRKNLLSDTTHCAIACYRTSYGSFYLTQMFARKY